MTAAMDTNVDNCTYQCMGCGVINTFEMLRNPNAAEDECRHCGYPIEKLPPAGDDPDYVPLGTEPRVDPNQARIEESQRRIDAFWRHMHEALLSDGGVLDPDDHRLRPGFWARVLLGMEPSVAEWVRRMPADVLVVEASVATSGNIPFLDEEWMSALKDELEDLYAGKSSQAKRGRVPSLSSWIPSLASSLLGALAAIAAYKISQFTAETMKRFDKPTPPTPPPSDFDDDEGEDDDDEGEGEVPQFIVFANQIISTSSIHRIFISNPDGPPPFLVSIAYKGSGGISMRYDSIDEARMKLMEMRDTLVSGSVAEDYDEEGDEQVD